MNTVSLNRFGSNEFVRAEDLQHLRNLHHIKGTIYIDLKEYDSVTTLDFLENLKSVESELVPSLVYGFCNQNSVDHLCNACTKMYLDVLFLHKKYNAIKKNGPLLITT